MIVEFALMNGKLIANKACIVALSEKDQTGKTRLLYLKGGHEFHILNTPENIKIAVDAMNDK